ncbi:TVP38/TMEM64 family protein [Arthrobacter sp. H20]|uniref:TVP38/TMEM64 family protein n=1 Tax=Arthrobacter sp. H20 TaxID=1267981 RepID=UPI0004ADD734|nr:TVP38/TMEM64 family protein [Arthrobacter sp. H20]
MQEEHAHGRPRFLTPIRRAVLLALLIAAATITMLGLPIPPVDDMRELVQRSGWWAPVGFLAGYAALTLAPLPKNVLSIAAGVLFGFGPGLVIVYCAAMLGASAAFWLGRALGREAVEKFTGTRVAKVDAILSTRGFMAVVGARLIPVLPFTAINYSAGLTALGWWPYLLGTMIGILPGTVSYLALGAFGLEFGWPAQLALALLGALTLAGAIVALRSRQKSGRSDV